MSIPRFVIVAVAVLACACGAKAAGPPEIVVDITACSHCGMLVSEPVFAAGYQVAGAEPRVFDDIGCMLNALGRETATSIIVWVQDAAGAGWLNADEATFVASPRFKTPMGGGVLAYADHAAAENAAAMHTGRVMRSWREVMTANGDTK